MSEYGLPVILLVLSFFVKLAVNRECIRPHVLAAISELPVDVMFISSAITITYANLYSRKVLSSITSVDSLHKLLNKGLNLDAGFELFIIYIVVTIAVTIFWRLSEKFFKAQKWIWFGGLLALNSIICICALLIAITKLNGVM